MGQQIFHHGKHLKLNVPVLYSDFGNIRSILKDAVYYIDPFQARDYGGGNKKNITRKKILENDLIKKGNELLNSINHKKDFEQSFKIDNS